MSNQQAPRGSGGPDRSEEASWSSSADASPVRAEEHNTGVAAVDQVLADVEEAGSRSLTEQVEVFERAHERLRRALDGAAEPG